MAIKPRVRPGLDPLRKFTLGFPSSRNHGNYSVQPKHLHTCLGEQCLYMNLYDGEYVGRQS